MDAALASPRQMQSRPIRQDTSLHPIIALRAVRELFRTGDTHQVFIVLQAMRGRSGKRLFTRFAASPTGQAIMARRPSLLAHLTDHATLSTLSPDTLGAAYLRFTTAAHLSPEGLVDAMGTEWTAPAPEPVIFFRNRMRDMHDLAHVLTGYGSDVLGELCLLAFNHAQTGHLGMAMIAGLGTLRASTGPGGWAAGRTIRRAVREAWTNGRAAAPLAAIDWETALTQPVDQLRRQHAISQPTSYQEALA